MDRNEWAQLRGLCDDVCEHPPTQWRTLLEARTDDPDLVDRTLAVLHAQTVRLRTCDRDAMPMDWSSAPSELDAGDVLDKWRLDRRLGGGGMGTVFLASRADALYEQQAAIKLLRGLPSEAVAAQLAAERQILAGLQHPNIARLYDGGQTPGGRPYLVMEYIEGRRLDDHCMQSRPGLDARLRLFLKICRAVQAAHRKLVVHCDLKPGNVLVTPEGEPVLLDFGIARLLDGGTPGAARGFCTPGYASPEQVAGMPVDIGSDVFSLGMILTEMLCCRPLNRRLADADAPVPLPSAAAGPGCAWTRRLRGDLDAVASMACALDPAARYPSVEAFADDVERHLSHLPVRARGGGGWYRFGRFARRRWQVLAAAGGVSVLTLVFVAQLVAANTRAEQEAAAANGVSDFLVSAFEAANPRKRGYDEKHEVTARELLEVGLERIDAELGAAPVQRARMLAAIGLAYQNMGLPRQAEAAFRRAVEDFLDPQVDDPVRAADVLSDLATELANDARGPEALEATHRALALLERRDDAAARAHALNSLGLSLAALQRYDEAEEAYMQALALRCQEPGADRADNIPVILHNLGLLYRQSGDLEKSEAFLRESLVLKRERGNSSAVVASSLQALANTLTQRGKHREAAGVIEQGLALAREYAGEISSPVAEGYNQLAGAYQDAGDYPQAAESYRRALEILERLGGGDEMSVAVFTNNFGTLEQDRGDDAAAERLFRRSWEIRRRLLGETAPPVLRAQANLARLLLRTGRLDEAGALLGQAHAVWAEQLKPGQPDLLRTRLAIAEWHLRRGETAQAEALLEQQRPHVDQAPAQVALTHRRLLAEAAREGGAFERAAALWRGVAQEAAGQGGPASPLAMAARLALAECLLLDERTGEARAEAEGVGPLLRARLVPGAEALRRLQALEGALGAGVAARPQGAGSVT